MLGLLLLVVGNASGLDSLSSLQNAVPGVPYVDYPVYAFPPDTGFICNGRTTGYYADPLSGCQAYHYCGFSAAIFGNIKYSSLCPNGTIFNQELFICDWWYRVDCPLAESFYALNDNIEAYADAYQEIEKPFLQPYEGDQDRSSYDQAASEDAPLDEEFGKYLLAADEIDLTASQAPDQSGGCRLLRRNFDLGQDFIRWSGVGSLARCQKNCKINPSCAAITWVKRGRRNCALYGASGAQAGEPTEGQDSYICSPGGTVQNPPSSPVGSSRPSSQPSSSQVPRLP